MTELLVPSLADEVVLAASSRGDQPRAGIEDHAALGAPVRGQRRSQALDDTCCRAIAQAGKGDARVRPPPDEREDGLDVLSVEDRLVHGLEAHSVEAGPFEEARSGVGIAQREWV